MRHRLADIPEEASPVERELRDLLSVEPSASFAARVRVHVQASPAPAVWQMRWRAAALGGMALLAMTVGAIMRQPGILPPRSGQDPVVVSTEGAPVAAVTFTPPANDQGATSVTGAPAPGDGDRQRRVSVPPGRSHPTAPPIVISRAESESLSRWLVAVREQRVVLTSALEALPDVDAPLADIEPIAIPELTIEPIESVGPWGS